MIFKNILLHQIKFYIRNENWKRNLFGKIIIWVLIGILILSFIFIGLLIQNKIGKFNNTTIDVFNSILLLYLFVDLSLRCLFQRIPKINIAQYLHLCISRQKIVILLLIKSFINLLNLLPWIVLIPVVLKLIYPFWGLVTVVYYINSLLLLFILNNLIAILFNILCNRNMNYMLTILIIPLVVILIEYQNVSIFKTSVDFGRILLDGNVFLFIFLITIIITIYLFVFKILYSDIYLDDLSNRKRFKFISSLNKFHIFSIASEVRRYVWLELILLFRNKRSRQLMSMTFYFYCYFLFMIVNDNGKSIYIVQLLLSLGISFCSAMYGQLIFSWESTFFDFIMSKKINFSSYVSAKFYIMLAMSLISGIIFYLFLVNFSKLDILMFIAYLIFNLGVSPFIVLFFSCFNDGRIVLSQKQYFNYQDLSGTQLSISLILVFIPFGMYQLVSFIFNIVVAQLFFMTIGILFLLFHRWLISHVISNLFFRRKYKNLEGYRKLCI